MATRRFGLLNEMDQNFLRCHDDNHSTLKGLCRREDAMKGHLNPLANMRINPHVKPFQDTVEHSAPFQS